MEAKKTKNGYKQPYTQAEIIAWEDRIRSIAEAFAEFRRRMAAVDLNEIPLKAGTFWHRIEQAESDLEKMRGDFSAQVHKLELKTGNNPD